MSATLTLPGFLVNELAPFVPPGAASAAALQAAQDALAALQSNVGTLSTTVAAQAQTDQTQAQILQALRSSVTAHVVGAGGLTTVTFTKTFAAFPGLAYSRIEASDTAGPVDFSVKSWTQDGSGNFIGAVIRAKREVALPSLTGILLLTNLISALSGFDVYSGSAVGLSFTLTAVQRTDA